jgi:glycosyltransferase involved in cell wall biosynthesis
MNVSVIIPTYNRLWCLPKAIASCRNTQCQTEIIVVDDGSTDGTWDWLQTQPDVVSIQQENWGKGWAVNRGFANSRGKYIRFLDSDDWLCPGAIDRQFEIAETQAADVVVGGYEEYSAAEQLIRKANWIECEDFIARQLGDNDSSHYSAYLFRREFIKEIPHRAEYGALDDRQFILEVALANPTVAVHLEPTLCHRHHLQGRLQTPRGMKIVANHLQFLTIYQKCLRKLAERGELTPRRKEVACWHLWRLAHKIAVTHLDEACEVVDWIYQLNPEFKPFAPGILAPLYTLLGFRNTEILLQVRRNFMALLPQLNQSKIHEFPV